MKYVIAKSYPLFLAYCQDSMIHPLNPEIKYVYDVGTLQGREYTKSDTFVFYEDWFLHPDAYEIKREVEWCKARRFDDK